MSFSVVFAYAFDHELATYLFETEDKAKEFLKGSYEEELRLAQEQGNCHCSGFISKDGWYAKVQKEYDDEGEFPLDAVEIRIGRVYV